MEPSSSSWEQKSCSWLIRTKVFREPSTRRLGWFKKYAWYHTQIDVQMMHPPWKKKSVYKHRTVWLQEASQTPTYWGRKFRLLLGRGWWKADKGWSTEGLKKEDWFLSQRQRTPWVLTKRNTQSGLLGHGGRREGILLGFILELGVAICQCVFRLAWTLQGKSAGKRITEFIAIKCDLVDFFP